MRAVEIARGFGWSALATAINAVAQLAFVAVLARLLDPAVFGLMGMAIVALRCAGFFGGMTQGLIQMPRIDADDIAAAHWMALTGGLVLWALLAACAPAFAGWFESGILVPVLQVIGATLPLSAIAAAGHALLRRAGRFGTAAAIDCIGYVVGWGTIGVVLAFQGAGIWSLVAAAIAQPLLAAAIAVAVVRPSWRWPRSRGPWQRIAHGGMRYSAIGMAEFAWANVETLAIGRQLGTSALGLYNRAITVANLPVEQAVGIVTRVLFPAFSAHQADRARVGHGFLVLLTAIGIVTAPVAAMLCATAGDVVAILLGPQWNDAAPVLAIVALAVPPMFLYVACGITLDSLAVLGPKLRLQLVLLVAKIAAVAGVAIVGGGGLLPIAIVVVAAEWIRLASGISLVVRVLALRRRSAWAAVGAGAAVGALAHAGAAAAVSIAAAWSPPLRLASAVVAGAAMAGLGAAALAARLRRWPPWIAIAPAWPSLAVGLAHRRAPGAA